MKTKELPRDEWAVVIQGHHAAYIEWETFLTNHQRLGANNTHQGARPPREGSALLQGIVICGSCGRPMSTNYSSGAGAYDCSHSRHDHTEAPQCRSVTAAVVDAAVVRRLLEVVAPEEIALALSAADEVVERRARSTRALDLAVERARYEAARAERAFHQCEPENRLVARSLEQRWELKLATVAEAEAALIGARAELPPLPSRDELEALARDLPRLWDAPSTSSRDRKRLLRTLVADVTLTSESDSHAIRVGIRWRAGAADTVVVQRPSTASQRWRTPHAAIEMVRSQAHLSDEEVVAALANAELKTGRGQPFDVAAVRWVRYAHHIPASPAPPLLEPGEATVAEVAAHCDVDTAVVYYWLQHGQLHGRRGPRGRWCVPFSSDVKRMCSEMVAHSVHIKNRSTLVTAGETV